MTEDQLEIWSFIVQIIGIITSVFITISFHKKKKTMVFTIVAAIMFVDNLIAQGLIMSGGPGLCIGSIILPVLAVFVSLITFYAHSYILDILKKKSANNKG